MTFPNQLAAFLRVILQPGMPGKGTPVPEGTEFGGQEVPIYQLVRLTRYGWGETREQAIADLMEKLEE